MKTSALLLSILFLLTIPLVAVSAADLIVPSFDLMTRGYMDSGAFVLGARGTVDLQIAGGYKFGGRLILNMESDNLEDVTNTTTVNFKSASVTAREPLKIPFELTYFIGEYQTFSSGDVFPEYFGSEPIATNVRGFLYFPESIRYNGIYNVAGTGLSFATSPSLSENFRAETYIYQDSYLGKGFYSADLRTILNFELFKMDTFFGYSFPVSELGLFRGGLMMFYKTGEGIGEFLTQVGIPRFDPWMDPFTIDLFYFLFEPRVNIGIFSVILTLFWHPEYYNQAETGELGTSDININFLFGDPNKSPISGGIESTLSFSTQPDTEQIQAVVSPYFSAITSGVIWNLKVKTKVFPFTTDELIEAYVGVKAEF